VIIVDTNVLVYAYNVDAEQHARARVWVERAFGGKEPIGLAWTVIHGFLRLTTSARVMPHPLLIEVAIGIVAEWLTLPSVRTVDPGSRYWPTLSEILVDVSARGNLVTDAHLAALAIECDAAVCTTDRDFAQFQGLRLINPLT
jgi:hypothetical protein